MSDFNPYIKQIDADSLKGLCIRYGELCTFRKGEYLIREGDVYPYFGFIETGIFKYVSVNKTENRQYNTGFAFPGEFVADYPACIYGMRSETNIQALTRSEIYINAEQLFLQTYSRYLDLYRLTPEERYLQLLNRCPDILQSVPLKEIASYLMITPTHMSRIRRKQLFG